MKKLKILAVCGFGVGSSMVLKMKVEDMLKANGLTADVFTADVSTAPSEPCDMIFTSREIGGQITEKVKVPVVIINNFLNKAEIEEKGLNIVKELMSK